MFTVEYKCITFRKKNKSTYSTMSNDIPLLSEIIPFMKTINLYITFPKKLCGGGIK